MSSKSNESPIKRIRKAMAAPPPAPRHRKSTRSISEARSHEDIARLAYALWESRGRQDRAPEDDWYQAQELLAKHPSALLR